MTTIVCHLTRGNTFQLPESARTVNTYIQTARSTSEANRYWRAAVLGCAVIASIGNAFSYAGKAIAEATLYITDSPRAQSLFIGNTIEATRSVTFAVLGLFLSLASLVYPHWAYSFIEIHSTPTLENRATSVAEEFAADLIAKNDQLMQENDSLRRFIRSCGIDPERIGEHEDRARPVEAMTNEELRALVLGLQNQVTLLGNRQLVGDQNNDYQEGLVQDRIRGAVRRETAPLIEENKKLQQRLTAQEEQHALELQAKDARITTLQRYEACCKGMDRFNSDKKV